MPRILLLGLLVASLLAASCTADRHQKGDKGALENDVVVLKEDLTKEQYDALWALKIKETQLLLVKERKERMLKEEAETAAQKAPKDAADQEATAMPTAMNQMEAEQKQRASSANSTQDERTLSVGPSQTAKWLKKAEESHYLEDGKDLYLQLHSVLDRTPEETLIQPTRFEFEWRFMLSSIGTVGKDLKVGELNMDSTVSAPVHVALPDKKTAKSKFTHAVGALANALDKSINPNFDGFAEFYRHFGWESPEEYFGVDGLGEKQVMVVDIDYNDLDDRLAIVILAYQMASANAHRQMLSGTTPAACTLFLDARTYAATLTDSLAAPRAGLCMWRTLRLADTLNKLLEVHGVSVKPILGEPRDVENLMATYFKAINRDVKNPDPKTRHAKAIMHVQARSAVLGKAGLSHLPRNWASEGKRSAVWVLGGLCKSQIDDFTTSASEGALLFIAEQAQPAWQSISIDAEVNLQPPVKAVTVGDQTRADEVGFNAEPSNVRSSAASYPETIAVYVRFQKLAKNRNVYHFLPALSRKDGKMPVPTGLQMLPVQGRPLNVWPGYTYTAWKDKERAQDETELEAAFANLLKQAKKHRGLHLELITADEDDWGRKRKGDLELDNIFKYGSFMADPIAVILAARPKRQLEAEAMTRRLAIVKFPKAEKPVPENSKRALDSAKMKHEAKAHGIRDQSGDPVKSFASTQMPAALLIAFVSFAGL